MGSGGGIPDIGVRLSASGVADVVAAFQRVRQEGKTAGVETTASLELINGALETMQELLPAISFVVAIDQLVELGLGARESAENIGKLSDKIGASVGTLSALSLAAHDSEVSAESLSNGLVKLAKSQQDATDGSVKQKKAFNDLGITLADLKTQDPAQLFVTVAEKLNGLPDGAHKAQIAVALFGKSGADLLPMLKSLGTDGFDAVVTKAKKLGLYLNDGTVTAARAAQDAFHDLQDTLNGIGTQLVGGFAQPLSTAIKGVSDAFTDLIGGQHGFEDWGKSVGHGVINVAGAFDELWKIIALGAANADMAMDKFHIAFNAVEGALPHTSSRRAEMASEDDASRESIAGDKNSINDTKMGYAKSTLALAKAEYNIDHPPVTPKPPKPPGGGGTGDGFDPNLADKNAQAESTMLQARADNELSIVKLRNQLEEAEDKRSLDAGLISLDDYYAKREQRIKDEAAAELLVLQKKQDAIAKMPSSNPAEVDKKQQATEAVQTQVKEVQMREQAAEEANAQDLAKAKHDAALQELSDQEKLKQLSGDKYGAEETQLQIELQQYTELLTKQKKSTDEINAAVAAYKQKADAKIAFGRDQEAGSTAMSNLNLGVESIQDQAANGSISNIEAQSQINQLQQKSLATLTAIGEQMAANAKLSGNAEAIAAAAQWKEGVDKLRLSLVNVTTAQTYLVNQLSTQGISALSTFFTAGISGAKSFSDALGDLATTFANIVAKMVSDLLIFYALQEILGLAGVKQSTITAIIGTNPFGGKMGSAASGYTGDGATNAVAGVYHGQEFVLDAATTKAYRPVLEMMAAGTLGDVLQGPRVVSRSSMAALPGSYADSISAGGGGSAVAMPPPVINITNTTGQQTTQKQTTGPGGRSITEIVVGAVAKDIASGGTIAKTLQTNYGVTRQGVRRG